MRPALNVSHMLLDADRWGHCVSPRPPLCCIVAQLHSIYPLTPVGRGGVVELGWRLWNWWSCSNTASSGNFNLHFTKKRGQSNAQYHVLTLASGPFQPLVVGPDKGERLHSTGWLPAIHCPPPALPSSRLAARRRRLVVVRTHITALVTARLGQRHVSSECDLVTREARERLPVRGLTIALGSRHLFRLSVKAQCRFLPDQSSPCRACLSPPLPACPRTKKQRCLARYEGING